MIFYRGKRSKGFTLLEVTIAMVLMLILIYMLFQVKSSMSAQSSRTSNASESLQAFFFLQQRLDLDLSQLLVDEAHPIEILSTKGLESNALKFHIVEISDTNPESMATSEIQYEFDPEAFMVFRNGEQIGTVGKYEHLEFYFEVPTATAPTAVQNNLLFRVTTIGRLTSLQVQKGTETERNEHTRLTMIGGVGIPYKTNLEEYPSWVSNHTSVPGP